MTDRYRGIAILGAGPAGLAVGHYARLQSIPFMIYEKAHRWGGNCTTHEWNGFRYDSGAHRIHGVDSDIVRECGSLLDGNISEVSIPSRIYRNGRQFVFPLELKNIIFNMPPRDLITGLVHLLRSTLAGNGRINSFEDLAIRRYGRVFAKQFLLDYTEKLWGMPCSELDTSLTGKRLSGLHFWGLVKELLFRNSIPKHMEGRFYYPEGGIGRLTDALAKSCGIENIRLDAAVTRIFHSSNRILAIELNNSETVEVNEVVSSLPMNRLLGILEPCFFRRDLQSVFQFRNLVLVALFIDKERITDAASLYFPGDDTLFTRAYEPRNRCRSMSPPGKTSLVSEIPCDDASPIWTLPDGEIAGKVMDSYCSFGWIRKSDVLGFEVKRMPDAYPVLKAAHGRFYAEADLELKKLSNLRITGRNGRYSYSWIHDQLRWGRDIVEK